MSRRRKPAGAYTPRPAHHSAAAPKRPSKRRALIIARHILNRMDTDILGAVRDSVDPNTGRPRGYTLDDLIVSLVAEVILSGEPNWTAAHEFAKKDDDRDYATLRSSLGLTASEPTYRQTSHRGSRWVDAFKEPIEVPHNENCLEDRMVDHTTGEIICTPGCKGGALTADMFATALIAAANSTKPTGRIALDGTGFSSWAKRIFRVKDPKIDPDNMPGEDANARDWIRTGTTAEQPKNTTEDEPTANSEGTTDDYPVELLRQQVRRTKAPTERNFAAKQPGKNKKPKKAKRTKPEVSPVLQDDEPELAPVPIGPDGRPVPTKDPDARIGWQSASDNKGSRYYNGYEVHAAVDTPAAPGGPDAPILFTGIEVVPAGSHRGDAGVRLVDNARAFRPVNKVLCDRAYNFSAEDRFSRPLYDRGISQSVDLHETQRTSKRGPGDFLDINGSLYAPCVPARLQNLDSVTQMNMPAEKREALHDQYEELARYAVSIHGRTKDGRIRVRGPAVDGKIRSESHKPSLRGKTSLPYCSNPACKCGSTATIPADDNLRARNDEAPYGTRAWFHDHRLRGRIETGFSYLKTHHFDLRRATVRVFGTVAHNLLLGVVLAGVNVRGHQSFNRDHGLPDPYDFLFTNDSDPTQAPVATHNQAIPVTEGSSDPDTVLDGRPPPGD